MNWVNFWKISSSSNCRIKPLALASCFAFYRRLVGLENLDHHHPGKSEKVGIHIPKLLLRLYTAYKPWHFSLSPSQLQLIFSQGYSFCSHGSTLNKPRHFKLLPLVSDPIQVSHSRPNSNRNMSQRPDRLLLLNKTTFFLKVRLC